MNINHKKQQSVASVDEKKKELMTRGQAMKKAGIITLTAASMITLLASNKALAASTGGEKSGTIIRPDNPGSSGGF